jgi:hypothetical protein
MYECSADEIIGTNDNSKFDVCQDIILLILDLVC